MLDTGTYKDALKGLYTATRTGALDADGALEAFVDGFVDCTAIFIKSGKINYVDGLEAGETPVTGEFNGSIE